MGTGKPLREPGVYLQKDLLYGRDEWEIHFYEEGYACQLDVSLTADDLRKLRDDIDEVLRGG